MKKLLYFIFVGILVLTFCNCSKEDGIWLRETEIHFYYFDKEGNGMSVPIEVVSFKRFDKDKSYSTEGTRTNEGNAIRFNFWQETGIVEYTLEWRTKLNDKVDTLKVVHNAGDGGFFMKGVTYNGKPITCIADCDDNKVINENYSKEKSQYFEYSGDTGARIIYDKPLADIGEYMAIWIPVDTIFPK